MQNFIPIVIIEFNSYKRTIKYIEDFINKVQCQYNFSFIVVDNADNDENFNGLENELIQDFNNQYKIITNNIETGFLAKIKYGKRVFLENSFHKFEVILVKSRFNYGFAIGNNIGTSVAQKFYKGIKYIIFSNSDIKFPKRFNLDKLINIIKNDNNIALVGPRVIGQDKVQQTPCCRKTLWQRWNFNSIIYPLNSVIKVKKLNTSDDTMFIDYSDFVYRIIGAFMLFDYNKFLEIGRFDEGTFLYAEELIIGEKLRKFNYKTYYFNDEVLIHEQGRSTKKIYNNVQTIINKFQSEIYYFKKYRGISGKSILATSLLFNIYVYKLRIVNFFKFK